MLQNCGLLTVASEESRCWKLLSPLKGGGNYRADTPKLEQNLAVLNGDFVNYLDFVRACVCRYVCSRERKENGRAMARKVITEKGSRRKLIDCRIIFQNCKHLSLSSCFRSPGSFCSQAPELSVELIPNTNCCCFCYC